MDDVKHAAGEWKVVVATETQVVISAMCVCGDDDCAWSATSYWSDWVHQPAEVPQGNCGDVVLVSLPNDAAVCMLAPGHDGKHQYHDLAWEHVEGTVLFSTVVW